MNMNDKNLEDLIKKIIMDEISKNDSTTKFMDKSGIGVVKASKITPERFDTGNPSDQVFVTDLFSVEESPRIGCGVMEMTASTFDWTLKYDEIDYITEGTLEVVIDGRKVVGNKGDVILIPKNSTIKFSAPEYAKFIYVVYPANWQSL